MVRNHIAEEHFISKFILSVSNLHEWLEEAMDNFDIKCQIWRHASSPCFKAVGASPKLYSIAHKSMFHVYILILLKNVLIMQLEVPRLFLTMLYNKTMFLLQLATKAYVVCMK